MQVSNDEVAISNKWWNVSLQAISDRRKQGLKHVCDEKTSRCQQNRKKSDP